MNLQHPSSDASEFSPTLVTRAPTIWSHSAKKGLNNCGMNTIYLMISTVTSMRMKWEALAHWNAHPHRDISHFQQNPNVKHLLPQVYATFHWQNRTRWSLNCHPPHLFLPNMVQHSASSSREERRDYQHSYDDPVCVIRVNAPFCSEIRKSKKWGVGFMILYWRGWGVRRGGEDIQIMVIKKSVKE